MFKASSLGLLNPRGTLPSLNKPIPRLISQIKISEFKALYKITLSHNPLKNSDMTGGSGKWLVTVAIILDKMLTFRKIDK